MTTLFLIHHMAYPPRSGAPLRAWQNISLLSTLGPVHVFAFATTATEVSVPSVTSWTQIDAREFPVRSRGVIPRLLRFALPREFPIENDFISAEINRRLSALVGRVEPQLIVVTNWHHALPRALRGRHFLIADTHNVESLLAKQIASAATARLSFRKRFQLYQRRRVELSYLKQVDLIWAATAQDAATLKGMDERLPPIEVWPNAIDFDAYAELRSGRVRATNSSSVPTIGYIGYYSYQPNADAAALLIEKIFPEISRSLPNSRLVLIGKAPTAFMQHCAARNKNIVVTEEVDDVREHLRDIDLLVVPLRTGGGSRIKILEAFAAGIAVVSTAKGAEGIEAVPGRDIETCDIESMGQRCLDLLLDDRRRRRQACSAYEVVRERYSWDALARRLPGIVARLGSAKS